jgi:hypothetical protein
MTSTPLLLQVTNRGPYADMVHLASDTHEAYCKRWGFDYGAVIVDGPMYPEYSECLDETRKALADHELVCAMDADCIVSATDIDLRAALPPWAWLGLVVHPAPFEDMAEPWHLNVGAQYWRSCPESFAFIDAVIDMREPGLSDQVFVNRLMLAGDWQQGLCLLPSVWNLNMHDEKNKDLSPIVAAWHGYRTPKERYETMRSWLAVRS